MATAERKVTGRPGACAASGAEGASKPCVPLCTRRGKDGKTAALAGVGAGASSGTGAESGRGFDGPEGVSTAGASAGAGCPTVCTGLTREPGLSALALFGADAIAGAEAAKE